MSTRHPAPNVTDVNGTNGTKIRPDFQTKVVGTVLMLAIIAPLSFIAAKVMEMSDRMTRLEVVVDKNADARIDHQRRTEDWQRRIELKIETLERRLDKNGVNGGGK